MRPSFVSAHDLAKNLQPTYPTNFNEIASRLHPDPRMKTRGNNARRITFNLPSFPLSSALPPFCLPTLRLLTEFVKFRQISFDFFWSLLYLRLFFFPLFFLFYHQRKFRCASSIFFHLHGIPFRSTNAANRIRLRLHAR